MDHEIRFFSSSSASSSDNGCSQVQEIRKKSFEIAHRRAEAKQKEPKQEPSKQKVKFGQKYKNPPKTLVHVEVCRGRYRLQGVLGAFFYMLDF